MSLAFAAGCLLALGATSPAHADDYTQSGPHAATTVPQASRGELGDWSARQNVIASERYDRLLESNLAFRRARERMECGPINDPQLHQQCLASFQKYEPVMVGSSAPPHRYHHYRGAGN